MKRALLLTAMTMTSTLGDVGTSLTNFFNKWGMPTNVTMPRFAEDQAAGYATGGGVSISGNVMTTSLAHVDLPSIRYGNCGDIDIYNGGFSFVKGEQLVATLKSVASSAAGYAFMLGLETLSPQFANTVKQMQSWANTINSIGINSCETGASLVSAVWPRSQMASQAICRSQAATSGILSDYVSSRHGCSESGTYDRAMNSAEAANPNILKDEFNIAWKVIHDDPFFTGAGGSALKYLFMSLTGTVVARKEDGGKLKVQAFPSKVFDDEFMQHLMHGGSAKIYTCTDAGPTSKCLTISETPLVLGPEVAMGSRMETLLGAMQKKVASDTPFSAEETALLNQTRLPLLRILNVSSAYRQGAAPVSLTEYAEVVAIDMLCQYIRNVLDVIRLNISRKMQIQFDASVLERYEESLNTVEARVKEFEIKTQRRVDQLLAIERKLNLLEKDIFSRIRATAPY